MRKQFNIIVLVVIFASNAVFAEKCTQNDNNAIDSIIYLICDNAIKCSNETQQKGVTDTRSCLVDNSPCAKTLMESSNKMGDPLKCLEEARKGACSCVKETNTVDKECSSKFKGEGLGNSCKPVESP